MIQLKDKIMNKEEEKQILLKVLCEMLPYGVKCYAYQSKIDGNDCECCGTFEGILHGRFYLSNRIPINGGKTYDDYYLEVKPYLRPMSSMTDEEKSWYESLRNALTYQENGEYDLDDFNELNDFLNRRKLDKYGLIKKGLALEAPEGMYNF